MLEPQWLTVDEVAAQLRVTPGAVRQWLAEGKLRGLMLGRRAGWRIAPDELARFIQERMR